MAPLHMKAGVSADPYSLPAALQGLQEGHAAASSRSAFSSVWPNGPLRLQKIILQALGIMALMLLNVAGNAGAAVFFLILLVMSFRGPAGAYKAMAICFMALVMNNAYVPKSLIWTPARLAMPVVTMLVFIASDASALRRSLLTPTYFTFALYVATMAACSIMSGWYTQIALLKLFNFWMFVTNVFIGAAVLRARKIDLTEWFVSLILAVEAFGLASILFGHSSNFARPIEPGQVLSSDVFNGAFGHPNCHSLFASMFVLFLAIIFVFGQYRNRWIALPAIGVWSCFMVLSGSRTSILATIIPGLFLVVYAGSWRASGGYRIKSNVSRSKIVAPAIVGLCLVFLADIGSNGAIVKEVFQFINKSKTEESAEVLDQKQILSSRQALIDFSWANFLESPVYGIGFQVAKTEAFVKMATVLTAPAEKGFLPTAVLEEGGILGASTFVLFLLVLIGGWVRAGNVAAIVLFAGFLVSSISEVSIFSPGGSGGFGWIMVGAGMILSDHCWQRKPAPAARSPRAIGAIRPRDLLPRPVS